MLLTASHTLFKLSVRPRAVTTPVRVHSPSGNWGETGIQEDLRPNLRPSPTQTTNRGAKKVQYFATVRLRECVSFLFDALLTLTLSRLVVCSFTARRINTEVTTAKAPPFVPSETWRQARQSARAPLNQGFAPASYAGIKSLDPAPCPAQNRAPSPEVDLAGQPPPRSTSVTEVHPSHGGPPPRGAESPLAHARSRVGHNVPPAHIETFPKCYRLSIALPRPGGAQLASEMITVSARRGGRLAVVADAWHLEHDC